MGLNYRDRVPIYVGKAGSGIVVSFNQLLQQFEIDVPDGIGAAALVTDYTLRGSFTEGDAGGISAPYVLSTIPSEAVDAANDTVVALSALSPDEETGADLGIPKRVTVENLVSSALALTSVASAVTAIATTAAVAQFGDLHGVTTPVTARSNLGVYSTTQVDALVAAASVGASNRGRVRVATTGNITIATALNAGDVLDTVTLADDDLVLVKDQTAPGENGVYTVAPVPVRATGFAAWNDYPGAIVAVAEGSAANADTLWMCTSNAGGTLGTTAITWSKLRIAGELLAANNLSDVASASTARSSLGLVIGTDVVGTSGTSTSTTGATLVNGGATSVVPLVVKGVASQTGDLQQWQNSAGTALARIGYSGVLVAAAVDTPTINPSSETGPYVTLDGSSVSVLNRTTVGNVALVVKGMASQSGNLTEWRNSAGTYLAGVGSGGAIASLAGFYGPSHQGSAGTGPWLGTDGSTVTVYNRTTASNVPLVVKGMASQSGNLTEWQDSAGAAIALITSSGAFSGSGVYAGSLQSGMGTGGYLSLDGNSVTIYNRTTASNVPLIVKSMASQSGNLQQWQDSAGTALAWVSSTGAIATNGGLVAATLGSASSGYPYLSLGNNSITVLNRTTASNVPLIVKGMASQTGSLQQWIDSSGTVLASVSPVGGMIASGGFVGPYLVNAGNTDSYVALTGGSVLVQNRNTTSNKALIVQGMAAQTGDLMQAQDSSGTVVAAVTAAGALELGHASDTTIARVSAGRVSVEGNPIVLEQQAVNAQTGTTYTLAASDCGKLVTLSNASAITLTLPQDSDATIPVGTWIDLFQLGAGQVTVAAGTGATLRKNAATAKLSGQYASAFVQKISANTWRLGGELAAS